jgi:8-oxo-dGTP diphosphatase
MLALSSAGVDVTVIVDGANVMGSRADGWWRDRAGAMARLYGELAPLAAHGFPGPMPGAVPVEKGAPGEPDPGEPDPGEPGGAVAVADWWFPEIVLVVEGRTRAMLGMVSEEPRLRVVAAPGEGDDEIAGLAGRLPGRRIVVTADRELRRRCEAAGAVVMGPRWLTQLLA